MIFVVKIVSSLIEFQLKTIVSLFSLAKGLSYLNRNPLVYLYIKLTPEIEFLQFNPFIFLLPFGQLYVQPAYSLLWPLGMLSCHPKLA